MMPAKCSALFPIAPKLSCRVDLGLALQMTVIRCALFPTVLKLSCRVDLGCHGEGNTLREVSNEKVPY